MRPVRQPSAATQGHGLFGHRFTVCPASVNVDTISFTMTTPAPGIPEPRYQPTSEQLARAAALRRFNRLVVYLPVLLGALVVLGLFVALIWLAVVEADLRPLASATADLLVVLAILPALALSLVLPGLAVAALVQRKQRDLHPFRSLQTLLWRFDRLIARVQHRTGPIMARLAEPVIAAHAFIAHQRTWLRTLLGLESESSGRP